MFNFYSQQIHNIISLKTAINTRFSPMDLPMPLQEQSDWFVIIIWMATDFWIVTTVGLQLPSDLYPPSNAKPPLAFRPLANWTSTLFCESPLKITHCLCLTQLPATIDNHSSHCSLLLSLSIVISHESCHQCCPLKVSLHINRPRFANNHHHHCWNPIHCNYSVEVGKKSLLHTLW